MASNRSFFTLPHPVWMALIPLGMYLLFMATVDPDKIPAFLGPVGAFCALVGRTYPNFCVFLCAVTVVIHIVEAAWCGKMCQDRDLMTGTTIKWVLSTTIFGVASLVRLAPLPTSNKRS